MRGTRHSTRGERQDARARIHLRKLLVEADLIPNSVGGSRLSIMGDEKLASVSLGLAWLVREVFQDMGFDYHFLSDGSKRFEVMRRME